MDFLQVVDPVTLMPVFYTHVALELAASVACTVLLGVCLHVLPERLVRRSKAARVKVPREAVAEVATPASRPAVPMESPTLALPAPSSSATAPKKTDPAPSPAIAESTLDGALESFFEEESLLDEALLDTVVPSAPPGEEAPPAGSTRVKVAQPSTNEAVEFSRELAAKMTKGLQCKARPATVAPPPEAVSGSPAKNKTAEKQLEDALDAYMAEEELLNEAMLDSAVAAAHRA
ncbi:hypothetical protein GH5_06870 [Leishmania sp. Ghana 2012 LV757]|uniref:hypothetical protein n=1 Tax=Leishmania sp. Ghana 2012 LV757 TaxID=2803181 RepID=UPI001B701C2D|nr:hypothetical protein GH5_06870 [Leishmania sp. Ghana 2012 LV757]